VIALIPSWGAHTVRKKRNHLCSQEEKLSMTLMKPLGILSIVGGIALLALAFAVGSSNGTAFAGEETPTAAATTGTPSGGTTGTPATTGTAAVTTPTRSAGGISTPTAAGGGGGAVTTPTAGAVTVPDTGTGPSDSGTDASLLWLLGAGALVAGAGAVVIGTKQRS
jgi:hypothetical protein